MERSQWWYALVGIAVVNVVWSLAGVLSGERITAGPATAWIVLGGGLVLLTPVFYYALYRDVRVVRDRNSSWTPDLRAWLGGGALLSVLGSVLFINPLTHYVAVLYLVQRARKRPLSDPATG